MAKKKTKKRKAAAQNKPRTKGEILRELADRTDLSRAQVISVFDEMSRLIKADLGKKDVLSFRKVFLWVFINRVLDGFHRVFWAHCGCGTAVVNDAVGVGSRPITQLPCFTWFR